MQGQRLPDVGRANPEGWDAWERRPGVVNAAPGAYMKVLREDGTLWCWYPIPRAKINGLLAALEQGVVRFNTGRTVEFEDCDRCGGTGKLAPVMRHSSVIVDERPCDRCGGEGRRLLVIGLANGRSRYRLDMDGEVERAYKMALFGPAPIPQPESKRDFGDDPPF